MKGEARKAAITAYKERKKFPGIYAVRCVASGQVWIGRSPDLESVQNRVWFTLRLGVNPSRSLQAAWSAEDGEGFTFEQIEETDGEDPAYVRDARLKERLGYWQAKLAASIL